MFLLCFGNFGRLGNKRENLWVFLFCFGNFGRLGNRKKGKSEKENFGEVEGERLPSKFQVALV